MDISMYLARVFGLYLIIVIVAAFVNRRHFTQLMDDFFKNGAFIFFSGIIHLVIGLFVVVAHNVWTADWRVIITLLAWAGVAKGCVRLFFPYKIASWMGKIKGKRKMIVWGAAMLLLGIYLTGVSFTGY